MYILQQEEYISSRFIYWLPRFFWRRNFQTRDSLKFTQRVKLTMVIAILLWLLSGSLSIFIIPSLWWLILPIFLICVPFFVLIANILSYPYYEQIRARIRKEAQDIISLRQNLRIVVIAGSYGKTTTKNFIYQFVKYNYKTQMIPGNINTPAGIGNWIKQSLEANTELLIAEVDAYEVGEIAKSCKMIPADIAILTNIGDQHLQRFNSQKELAEALSEVFKHAKPTATLLASAETVNQLSGISNNNITVVNQEISYLGEQVPVPELSQSNLTNLIFALRAAELLNIPYKFVIDSLSKLELPDRRQKTTDVFGFSGIDDSYNISYTTAQAGISAAKHAAVAQKKKLLVITAGIPELSEENSDKNQALGKILSKEADLTIILNSILASDVASGMEPGKYNLVSNLQAFLQSELTKYNREEWFILLQPELNDLYY